MIWLLISYEIESDNPNYLIFTIHMLSSNVSKQEEEHVNILKWWRGYNNTLLNLFSKTLRHARIKSGTGVQYIQHKQWDKTEQNIGM